MAGRGILRFVGGRFGTGPMAPGRQPFGAGARCFGDIF